MKKMLTMWAMMLSVGVIVYAGTPDPMSSLRESIDKVINILKDPQYNDASKKEIQANLIWDNIKIVFDFDKMGELALGRFRKDFSEQQLSEFTAAFSDLIGNTYLRRIQGEYKNEKVDYLSQRLGEGKNADKASVETNIIREGVVIPVSYTMWLNNDAWRIYDVKVEGVSLVLNYRNQFQKILLDKSPDYLIAQIKKKNEKPAEGTDKDEIE